MASIRERNGSYQITVSCGYDIKGKKLIETTTYTPDPTLTPRKQQKAVENFAREFEAKIQNGSVLDGRKITLKEFVDRWLKEYAEPKLQPGTVKKYREELDDKILPALGHLKMSDLKPRNINALFLSLAADGARKDESLEDTVKEVSPKQEMCCPPFFVLLLNGKSSAIIPVRKFDCKGMPPL